MWTDHKQYERNNGRYASDLTDEEWKVTERFVPGARALGRSRETDMHEVVNALLYIAETGCQWRMLARDHPLSSGNGSARGGRSRGQPHRRRNRQPVGENPSR